jgi:hypothetical protein
MSPGLTFYDSGFPRETEQRREIIARYDDSYRFAEDLVNFTRTYTEMCSLVLALNTSARAIGGLFSKEIPCAFKIDRFLIE